MYDMKPTDLKIPKVTVKAPLVEAPLVVVVGGGNAGIEAAYASAKMGVKTLLITRSLEDLGHLPCNSSIGGSGRSQLLREIDVLGSIITRAADLASTHTSVLRTAKGMSNYCVRHQVDRLLYKKYVRQILSSTDHLTVKEGTLKNVHVVHGKVVSIEVADAFNVIEHVPCHSLVLTVGTFLGGSISRGKVLAKNKGRIHGSSSKVILHDLQHALGELKTFSTGTSPLLYTNSINFSACAQHKSQGIMHLSLFSEGIANHPHQSSYYTYTSDKTARLLANEPETAAPDSVGIRYCFSLNEKSKRFPDKRHQIFIQPEGLSTYIQCAITGSNEYQDHILRSIPGFEHAHVIRHGYKVTYHIFDPYDSLATSYALRRLPSVFLAGQINGTSGYEEAASQGLIAGLNAALYTLKRPPVVFTDDSYLGTMTRDLQKGIKEPYRMLPTNCSKRVINRYDNAHVRLAELSLGLDLLTDEEKEVLSKTVHHSQYLANSLEETYDQDRHRHLFKSSDLSLTRMPLKELLLRNYEDISWDGVLDDVRVNKDHVRLYIDCLIKFHPYIAKFEMMAKRMPDWKALKYISIPANIDYKSVKGLSAKTYEILSCHRPKSFYEVEQLPHVRASDRDILWRYIKRYREQRKL